MADKGHEAGGILRRSPHGADARARRASGTGGIRWDEAVIAEHDKDRGTRTKIDEPKTPFRHARTLDDGHHPPPLDEESLRRVSDLGRSMADEWAAVQAGLQDAADDGVAFGSGAAAAHPGRRSEWDSSDDEGTHSRSARAACDDHAAPVVGDIHDSDTIEALPAEDQERLRRFKEARRAHYAQEIVNVRELMKRSHDDEEDDEDENEAEDGGGVRAGEGGAGRGK